MPNSWLIREMPENTKRKIRVYAASNGLTIAQAVTDMVDYAFAAFNASNATVEAQEKE